MTTTTRTDDETARFVFVEWDRRARNRDVPGLLDLYAGDAVLETPLAPRVLNQPSGVLRGKDELARFFEEGGRRRPNELVRWHRDGTFVWNGRTLFWEYRRDAAGGEQVDIAEVMELRAARLPLTASTGAGSAPRCSSPTPSARTTRARAEKQQPGNEPMALRRRSRSPACLDRLRIFDARDEHQPASQRRLPSGERLSVVG
jgi:hypothetical protein